LFQKVKDSCKLKKFLLLGHNPSCINHLVNHLYMPSSVIYIGMFCMLTFKTSVPFCIFLPKFRKYIFVSYYVCETHLVWELSLQLPCISCTMHGASKFQVLL
jgi:hypothetical protein